MDKLPPIFDCKDKQQVIVPVALDNRNATQADFARAIGSLPFFLQMRVMRMFETSKVIIGIKNGQGKAIDFTTSKGA